MVHSGYVARAVCDVMTLGQVEQHRRVAEWVRHDNNAADGNAGRLSHHTAARGLDIGTIG